MLSPSVTVGTETLLPGKTKADRLEVCPQGGVITEHMSSIITSYGGCALIVDYGEYGSTRHSPKGIKIQ